MTFQEKIQQLKQKMFDAISTKDISFLWNLDKRIDVNKFGKFSYHNFIEFDSGEMVRFLSDLEIGKIYAVIPILSKNVTPDEPFIVLSQTFLITIKSNHRIILEYINQKIFDSEDWYSIERYKTGESDLRVTFKYKEVKFDYKEFSQFNKLSNNNKKLNN